MISLQRRADPEHIHWPPIESNKTRVNGIAPILVRKGDYTSLKIPHRVIVPEAQRCLFADLPDGRKGKAIIDDIAAGEELKSAKLKIKRCLRIE
jgi:hypothetical protein